MSVTNADVVVNCGEDEIKSTKRRYTLNNNHFSGGRYNNNKRKRRNDIVLPTRFLLGGNITDPLNLASFSGKINQVTPESSPLPTPKHKKEVEVLIPVNLSDPLNLNSTDPEAVSTIPVCKLLKSRKRKRKRTDSETTVDDDGNLAGPSGLDVGSSGNNASESAEISRGVKSHDSSLNSESTKEFNEAETSINKSGADKLVESGKDDEKSNSARTSNNSHHHPRASHPRFSRGSNPYHYQPYHHRTRQHHPQQQTMHKFRPKDAKFQYGNYDRYYGYRNQNLSTDPRLKCFKTEWFEDLDVLDIGCNVGHVTLTIARDFNPKKIIGIDIDENLIKSANRNVKNYVSTSSLKKRLDTEVISKHKCDRTDSNKSSFDKDPIDQKKEKDENNTDIPEDKNVDDQDCSTDETNFKLEKSESNDQSNPNALQKSSDESPLSPVCTESSKSVIISSSSSSVLPSSSLTQPQSTSSPNQPTDALTTENVSNQQPPSKKIRFDFCKSYKFPRNVQFFSQNYVLDSDELLEAEKPEYDCILCLSVTKWIHLNFGDDGLKRVFKRMYRQLRPGGKLILEAQPWCSYKKKKFISQCTLNNYWRIKFKPDHFNEYLLSKEVGFSTLELVDIPEHESKGFRRPIFLFRKPKESS